MNANFGIILRKAERGRLLVREKERPTVIWFGEAVDKGPPRFTSSRLDDLEFGFYPLTSFVYSKLGTVEPMDSLEYAQLSGEGLNRYERWTQGESGVSESPVEAALDEFLGRLSFRAVCLFPEHERLGEVLSVQREKFFPFLREHVRNLWSSPGFIAVVA